MSRFEIIRTFAEDGDYKVALAKLIEIGTPRLIAKDLLFAGAYGMSFERFCRTMEPTWAHNIAEAYRPEGLQ